MALLSSRSDGRDYAKGALEPNVAGDQWSEKQNTNKQKFLLIGLGLDVLIGDDVLHWFDCLGKTLDCMPAAWYIHCPESHRLGCAEG